MAVHSVQPSQVAEVAMKPMSAPLLKHFPGGCTIYYLSKYLRRGGLSFNRAVRCLYGIREAAKVEKMYTESAKRTFTNVDVKLLSESLSDEKSFDETTPTVINLLLLSLSIQHFTAPINQ